MTITRRWAIAGAITAFAAVSGCTRLGTLNGVNDLTPGDGGTDRLAADVAYGRDPRQQLDIYAPTGARTAPVLVFFYGGSWNSGRRQDYAFAARALAARGFVVVVPDYRLVPQVTYPGFVEDGAAAVAWAVANIARYGGDPARLGVTGHSAGAYIALMLALDRRWLAAAGTPDAVKAAVGLAGPYDFAPFEPGGAAEAAFGGFPDVRATQPVTYARAGAPPVLLLTGADDTTVRPRNAVNLAAALTAAGSAATVKTYPGIGHIGIILALSKPFRGKAPALADSAAFFRARLG
ncbi:alpha/beta hydrolase [Sandarakinorhabdus sp. DWP1-3-1]|uniref:alpha/beta hydrolase n=1 Tax=Sandarakinorhabdus sp. DWP1-3-1 TaxID=2804627 RepID=UPI003CFAFC06